MKPIEKKLLKHFSQLADAERDMLLSYAEFLLSRQQQDPQNKIPDKPLDIPRPDGEAVVAAIKRLTATYPMIESHRLLDKTSTLMTQHVMQGREAILVIDELEVLFQQHYDSLLEEDPSKLKGNN